MGTLKCNYALIGDIHTAILFVVHIFLINGTSEIMMYLSSNSSESCVFNFFFFFKKLKSILSGK